MFNKHFQIMFNKLYQIMFNKYCQIMFNKNCQIMSNLLNIISPIALLAYEFIDVSSAHLR